ncbi:hypothetical protein B0H16DRAFT_1704952 [Mycena metata]|uniref:Uncharacterized protein n=1 Tax=Mycena metata TaxID=1033252 RepID=A0AAD7GRT8_9AGAR|nr:hypothetical protein B0H16DRAFT_1704952 [Mycena metata]
MTADIMADARGIQEQEQLRHQEVLDIIETISAFDSASSISKMYSGSYTSSNSISMLPAEPRIFYGRDSELAKILKFFNQGTPRIAILGLIGTHLGMKLGKDLTQAVLKHFTNTPPSLLILDNLETPWEPVESRKEVENITSLALMVTMRGAERPAKVQWTRPFLLPLGPLSQEAARRMFGEIADDSHSMEEVDQVLHLAHNMPLSISLLAHLVDMEDCSTILSRWETEKTPLISEGSDRRSNLELSISLSLSSPRMTSMPHTQDLLALLSVLPDGLSDVELKQTQFLMKDILSCKTVLLCTALAYTDDHKRLKVLVPVREYTDAIKQLSISEKGICQACCSANASGLGGGTFRMCYWEGSQHPPSWSTVFLAHSLKTKERLNIQKAFQFLGDVFLKENDEATAVSLFTAALEGFMEMDVHRSRAECIIRLGDISKKNGDFLRALELWETARPLFERSSQSKQVQNIDKRLAGINEEVKQQHRLNLARLAELNAPAGNVEELEEDSCEGE